MKLRRIVVKNDYSDELLNLGYWMQSSQKSTVKLETDEGSIFCTTFQNWITDHRSGSCVADIVIPKWATPKTKGIKYLQYNAIIRAHDLMYSGWASKELADELLYQGLILSGVSNIKAWLALKAVRSVPWAWYNLDQPMHPPYANNRFYESYRWETK